MAAGLGDRAPGRWWPTWPSRAGSTLVAAAADGLEVGLAVANAAVSFVGPFLDQPAASRAATVPVNCLATTELAAWALPPMVAARARRLRRHQLRARPWPARPASPPTAPARRTSSTSPRRSAGSCGAPGSTARRWSRPRWTPPAGAPTRSTRPRCSSPPVDPRVVVDAALDRLPDGGWFLADPGLELVAGIERARTGRPPVEHAPPRSTPTSSHQSRERLARGRRGRGGPRRGCARDDRR